MRDNKSPPQEFFHLRAPCFVLEALFHAPPFTISYQWAPVQMHCILYFSAVAEVVFSPPNKTGLYATTTHRTAIT